MIYNTIGLPRSGSSYLQSYCRTYHIVNKKNVITLGELFLSTYYIDNQNIAYNNHSGGKIAVDNKDVASKIKFLKKYPNSYSFKFIPSTIPEEYRCEVLEYLNKCNLLTINRDPFDMFLSYMYQIKTGWKESHGATKPLLNILEINLEDIKNFLYLWDLNTNFINRCKIYHTFEYEDLDRQLLDFFQLENSYPGIKKMEPMQINYKSLILDYHMIKEKFDAEIQSKNRI